MLRQRSETWPPNKAADEGWLEPYGSAIVGTVIVLEGEGAHPSQLIASVRRTSGIFLVPANDTRKRMSDYSRAETDMSVLFFLAVLSSSGPVAGYTPTRLAGLPDGARSEWVVAEPEEIVAYLAFDPATVQRRLPSGLRFTTLEELATGGIQWAKDFLSKQPTKAHWGVSFLEFVRMGTFAIDGRAPEWPKHGAAALWLARVAPSDPATDLGPGRPFLALDFWVPDRAYVAYMLEKGYYATYGDVRLYLNSNGQWSGSLQASDINATAECIPAGPVTGGPASAGTQAIFPPASSPSTEVVRVAFGGHQEQSCEDAPPWRFRGTHPLVDGIVLGSPSFQFGYHLRGGTYPRP